MGRDLRAADIGPEDDALRAETVERVAEKVRLPDGDGPEDDMAGTGLQDRFQVGFRLEAAAPFHVQAPDGGEAFQHGQVHRTSCLGAFQVHDMDAPEAGFQETRGHFLRAFRIPGLAGEIALGQPDTAAGEQVDGGNDLNHRARKLRRIRAPAGPLFSGWNWVP